MTMFQKLFLLLIVLFPACVKSPLANQKALLHEQLCIENLEKNNLQTAKTHCEICIEYDEAHPECLNGLGLIHLANNHEEKARIFFHKAVRQNNDFSQARSNLGVIFFMNMDFEKANKYFLEALAIDPGNLNARYNSALSYIRIYQKLIAQGKEGLVNSLSQAKEQLQKLLVLNKDYQMGFRELGLVEIYLGLESKSTEENKHHLHAAKKAFGRCLKHNQALDVCYEGLGQVESLLGDYFSSWKNYFLCLGQNPQSIDCKNGIITAYEGSIKSDNAISQFKELSINAKNTNQADAYEAYCYVLFDKGYTNEAIKECQKAIKLKPTLCEINFVMAQEYQKLNDLSSSREHCQKFLQCNTFLESTNHSICRMIIAGQESSKTNNSLKYEEYL